MRAGALRVGLFTLGGLLALALAVVAATGHWMGHRERAVMRFQSSVYGLQVGAPVVLRGVPVGQVTAIGLVRGAGGGSVELPVTAELDGQLLAQLLSDAPPAASSGGAVRALVARGLVARLATQSLLTGLLYVDLDLGAPGAAAPAAPGGELPVIPTAPTRLQTLQAQLEGLDLGQIGRDLAAVAASTRQLLADPQARQVLVRTAEAAQSLQQLARALERDAGPLARSLQETLAQTRRTLGQVEPVLQAAGTSLQGVGQAAARVDAAASQVGDAAVQARELARAAQPLVADLRRSADEIARAAATLREATAPQSPLRAQTEAALQEVSRAATALRELATLLEQHPSAIVWGRPKAP
ncbi:MAG: MlaD family protein [Rubrivivax sp.]